MRISPCIVVDTREQGPLVFANLPTERGTLDAGDYSVRGLEHLVAVERKILPDLAVCVGHDRDRFKRELQRLRAYRFRLLVVEASAADLELGDWRSQVHPAAVLGSLAAWTAQYALPIWLAGDHAAAGRFVEKYLYQCARAVATEHAAAAEFIRSAPSQSTSRGARRRQVPEQAALAGHADRCSQPDNHYPPLGETP